MCRMCSAGDLAEVRKEPVCAYLASLRRRVVVFRDTETRGTHTENPITAEIRVVFVTNWQMGWGSRQWLLRFSAVALQILE